MCLTGSRAAQAISGSSRLWGTAMERRRPSPTTVISGTQPTTWVGLEVDSAPDSPGKNQLNVRFEFNFVRAPPEQELNHEWFLTQSLYIAAFRSPVCSRILYSNRKQIQLPTVRKAVGKQKMI